MYVLAYTVGDVFLSMLYFFLFLIWIYLFIVLISDVFRSRDLTGWGKAGWVILMIVFPLIGVLAYLIVRGSGLHERQAEQAQRADEAFRDYVRQASGGGSTADELAKLADLRARGVIDDTEYERLKAEAISGETARR